MTQGSRDEMRRDLLSRIPRWYSPWLHLAIPAVTGLAVVAVALGRIHDLQASQLAFVPLFVVVGNAVEWHAHRDLLHRRTWPLEILYVRHTPQHHAIYVSEDMYIREWRELRFVLLPAYGVVGLVAVTSPITAAFWVAGQPNLAALWVTTVVLYVLTYEWLHLAYHMPADGFVGRLRVTRWLRRHHQRHHHPPLMQRWNFNVTVPVWDLVRGTVWRAHEHETRSAVPRRA
ncbi:MAG TPA: fatty acid hydroxylase [Anaeromyxobacter sp.]|nr:fatty acid hydroxylase [Anaeromyxobacter sp.]